MTKETFAEDLKLAVAMALPPSFRNSVMEVIHVNGFNDTGYDALTIHQEGSPISPSINIDAMYEDYQNGRSMASIATEIVQIKMQDSYILDQLNIADIGSFESIRDEIFIRLCDKDNNTEHLENMVTQDFSDLTATYRVNLGTGTESVLSTGITEDLIQTWGVTMEEVHQAAIDNSSPRLYSMAGMMEQMIFGQEPVDLLGRGIPLSQEEIYEDMPMFVITNGIQVNGASVIVDTEVMKQVCQICGGDGYILPSSIHECLFIPADQPFPISELTSMVETVNAQEVAPRDILSNKVQFCDKETGMIMNAELWEQQKLQKEQELSQKQQAEPKNNAPEAKGPKL